MPQSMLSLAQGGMRVAQAWGIADYALSLRNAFAPAYAPVLHSRTRCEKEFPLAKQLPVRPSMLAKSCAAFANTLFKDKLSILDQPS